MKKLKSIRNLVFSAVFAVTLCCVGIFATNATAATTAPTSLTFTQNSDTSSTITWKAVSGATYNVYKAASRYATYNQIAQAKGITTTSYTDDSYSGEYYKVTAVVNGSESSQSVETSYEISTFGYNTYVFEQTDDTSKMQSKIDTVFKTTESGQFGSDRYAYLFTPGTYSDSLKVKVGFYTQVAGLGISPKDTTLGTVDVPAEWMIGTKYNGEKNYNALCNFWRTCENLTTTKKVRWAVSQATSMRRMNINGNLELQENGGYASGGFLADSKISNEVQAISQQQWLTRNTTMGSFWGSAWNYVFTGCGDNIKGAEETWPKAPNTVVSKTPVVQEKPFLTVTDGKYGVFVPELRKDSTGVSWDTDDIKGETIDLDKFYVAKPGVTAKTINEQLAAGKNLILTPGIYNISEAIKVTNKDTVILGLGLATLKPTNGNRCMTISDVDGVIVSGVLFDAGRKNSDTLLTVGESKTSVSHESNPICLIDTFYRVGGADSTPCQCTKCVVINSNDVIGDNFWVWRADHGAGVGWYKNKSDNGIIINGDNVTTYGLMVEHFQKYQTIWNGDNGRCYMYQSELPYDVQKQSEWNAPGSYGYTDYKVSNNVNNHLAIGMGIYSCYQQKTGSKYLKSAIECPDKPNVKFTNVNVRSLTGNGTIDYAINKSGYAVLKGGEACSIFSYSNGKSVQDKTYDYMRRYLWATTISAPSKLIYTGKVLTPKVSVEYSGITLRKGIDYTITFKNTKKIGKGSYKIVGINGFRETVSESYKIVPAKVSIKKVKKYKSKIKVTFKKVKGASKYQVIYANNKKFKKKSVITTKKSTASIKRKYKKKAYYVKVRAFKKVGKKIYYGSYSKVKKVKAR